MSKTFKINDRVRFVSGEHEGLVGQVEEVQAEFDDQQGAALVSISGTKNDLPVLVKDWFFFEELELAA